MVTPFTRVFLLPAIAFSGLLLAGCGGQEGFSPEVAANYMRACTASGQSSAKRCLCIMTALEKQYTEEEFHAVEIQIQSTLKLPDQFAQTLASANRQCGT
ncbi:hypothetical protein [Vogesella indigofera]|uniref:Lipoprotein n=1 Tax=Vogesella indigofera TaxID=45465 RepID=A0ABT5I8S0_VOGIN|nr:hypothetical protein [Vogesella indigofera]MDC7692290.1 hypothetical protein [Vogesella indigofera]